jgi:TonB family protein
MDKQQTRRLLIVAFVLSLLIHALFATRFWWGIPPPPEPGEVTIATTRVTSIAHTPQPTPRVTVAPTAAATSRPRTSAPGRGNRAPIVAAAATPTPTPLPTPLPSATPSVSCVTQDAPVALLATPPPPDIAPDVRGAAVSSTIRVRVDVDASGTITGTTVVEPSGNSSLDLVAVGMARAARYSPATHACKAIAGSFVFAARFSAW